MTRTYIKVNVILISILYDQILANRAYTSRYPEILQKNGNTKRIRRIVAFNVFQHFHFSKRLQSNALKGIIRSSDKHQIRDNINHTYISIPMKIE